jgi:hypothetical protein
MTLRIPSFNGRLTPFVFFLAALLAGQFIVSAERSHYSIAAQVESLTDNATVSLTDFGAVGNGVADDGPALQAALNSLSAAGGGTLIVPPGTYAIATPVSKDFSGLTAAITIQGQPSATMLDVAGNGTGLNLTSELLIKVGQNTDALTFKNLSSLLVRDVVFLGVQEVVNDAHVVVAFDGVANATIEHSEFYGLASLTPGGAMVLANNSGLKLDQVAFLGCSTNSGVTGSVVQNTLWKSVSITNTKFIDYGYRPNFYSKTPLAAPYSWISVGNAAGLVPASSRREAFVQNVFLDEGAYIQLSSRPEYFATNSAPFEIFISRLRMNVNNLRSVGIYMDGVAKTMIERSFFGWSHNAAGAMAFFRGGEVILDQVECVANANKIIADSSIQLTVINSIYTTLESDPARTRVIVTTNPLDDPVQYVRQQFLSTLNRDPDAPAYFYWVGRLLSCQGPCFSQIQQELATYLAASPEPKFQITGRVTDEGGAPIAQVNVQLSGSQNVSAVSDAGGNFTFANLATSGQYTISPGKEHYNFQPRTFVEKTTDQVADFVGVLQRHTIRGLVMTPTGVAIQGATLTLTGAVSATTLSNANGNFAFPNMPGGGDFTLVVSHNSYAFPGNTATIVNLSADQNIVFAGTLVTSHSISGKVTAENNQALPGATVNLTGALTLSVITDAAGNFSFTVPAEANYLVSATKIDYVMSPASYSFNNLSGNQTANFNASRAPFVVGGRITDGQSGASDVEVRITGSVTRTVTTDGSGDYTLSLAEGGSYTLTPSAPHYEFTPASIQFTNLSAPQTANFQRIARDTVEFANSTYQVSEGVPTVSVTVTRRGDTSGPAAIRYSMIDETATQDSDYILATGLLQFAANETTKTFPVIIINDGWVESAQETARLALSDPQGFVLGEHNQATLTILDNTTPPTINPIEDTNNFVQQQYGDFLARPPDDGGLAYWTNQITSCGSDQICVSSRRVGVSAAFFVESEFQQTGGFVVRLFDLSLGRRPLYLEFMRDRGYLNSFNDLQIGKTQLADDFVRREEFLNRFPESLSPSDFIDQLLDAVLANTGVDLSSHREELLAEYTTSANRGQVLLLLADYAQLQQAEFNRAFVLMQYFGYLRRDPDPGGYDFWLNILDNRLPGNFRGMVCAFLTSREYQERFGPSVPRTDQECALIQ